MIMSCTKFKAIIGGSLPLRVQDNICETQLSAQKSPDPTGEVM